MVVIVALIFDRSQFLVGDCIVGWYFETNRQRRNETRRTYCSKENDQGM